MLHEIGHAAIHLRDVPVLGGEEDAADRFAIVSLIEVSKKNAATGKLVIFGELAYKWRTRQGAVSKLINGNRLYADEHLLNEQRAYNMICLAYGSNPNLFADISRQFRLTEERAMRCPAEYQQAERAFKKLFKFK